MTDTSETNEWMQENSRLRSALTQLRDKAQHILAESPTSTSRAVDFLDITINIANSVL